MNPGLDRYSQRFSALGRAGLDLLQAETALLRGELRGTAGSLLRVLLLCLAVLAVLFWALAVAVFVGIEVGALWIPRWAAALSVLGILLLIALVIGLVARRKARRLETPAVTVRRRIDDHREWWRQRFGDGTGSPKGDRSE